MNTTSLVAEFLVIGLIPFLTILFAVLSALNIYDFGFLSQMKEFSTLLTVVVTLSIYLLGALTHRLGQLLNRNSLSFIFRRFIGSRPNPDEEWIADYVLVLQLGSEQLVSRIQYGESLSRIFKSVTITAPLLAVVLALWLSAAVGWRGVAIAVTTCALVTIASFVSFLLQRRNYQQMVRTASKLLMKRKQ